MQMEAAHELSHRIEKAIKESCPGVTDIIVHLEPGACQI
jgi:divalent metal cation (Fe/Co/Zn/Cd) transporter